MGPHYLDHLFNPESIAVIGASDRPGSVGRQVFANLREAGFKGQLYPVNPKHDKVQGYDTYPAIGAIGQSVDMAVIATPAATVPQIIRECGEEGVHVVIILSAGFAEGNHDEGRRIQQEIVATARRYGIRLMGPNCLGIQRSLIGLNATFSRNSALAGDIALVSQSGALCTSILDWATSQEMGFSAVVSLGAGADIDFGDILDYLALDGHTKSILLYVEGIQHARSFISGLRAAARLKPVIVVKAGRHGEGTHAAISHTGALVGAVDVFNAAIDRAGAVRATTIDQLFSAAKVLAAGHHAKGNRLAIITNGGGLGVMAVDRAVELDIKPAELTPTSIERLNKVLPPFWSHGNPVDILGDAPPQRYKEALSICLDDPQVDGCLVMLAPQAMTDPLAAAEAIIETASQARKPILSCWMGGGQVAAAHALFTRKHISAFSTPETAVEAFSYLSSYHRNQQLLLQVPGPLSRHKTPDVEGATLIIEGALAEGRTRLSGPEAKALLTAFGINTATTHLVHSASEALVAAESLGFPVAMKIESPDIAHKSDVGGVILNIENAAAVRSSYQTLVDNVKRLRPEAAISGVTIESMQTHAHGRELMIGVIRDEAFGPAISVGAGGVAVEVLQDRTVALPPLNHLIARNMIAGTRMARLLEPYRNIPGANIDAIEYVLRRVSEMVCEIPHIRELDINPLIVDESAATAVDARIVVAAPSPSARRYDHMAIHPYPAHLGSHFQLADGTNIMIRPIRPEDAGIEQDFVRNLSSQSRYFRFMHALRELTQEMLVRFTQIDYDREMAFIAVVESADEPARQETEIGVSRYTINPDGSSCEFALVVADAWQHKGIGSHLMAELINAARQRNLSRIVGEVLSDNHPMLELVAGLGFNVQSSNVDPGIKEVELIL